MSLENKNFSGDNVEPNCLWSDKIPVPRYTYPIVIGMVLNFPREIVKKPFIDVVVRMGAFAPYAVSLNEAADIGISAQLKIDGGVRQEKFVPLLQTDNLLFNELYKRRERFTEMYPVFKDMVGIVENDFLLLSRQRNNIQVPDFVEIDSGIIEAAYTEVAMPGYLSSLGMDFPGKSCQTKYDLTEKYKLYLSRSDFGIDRSKKFNKIRGLHGLEMTMKLDDDVEGEWVDKMLGLPNYWVWLQNQAEITGTSSAELLKIAKKGYLEMARKVTMLNLASTGITFLSNVSGKSKDLKSCNGVVPTDDLWQITKLIGDNFNPHCTALRHQLESSGLLDRAFGK